MSELKICRICLRTEAKMYKYDQYQLKCYYEEVMALKVNESDGLPQCFCYECAIMLHKFRKFKEKCYIGHKALKEILWRGPITYEAVYKVDRSSKNLQSPLDIIKMNNQVRTYIIKDETNTSNINENEISENHENCKSDYSTTDREDILNVSIDDIGEEKIDNDNQKISLISAETPSSPITVFVDIKKQIITLKSEEIRNKQNQKEFKSKKRKMKNSIDLRNWRKYDLSEEEALIEFRARAQDNKYLEAAFKCMNCFKGFSKKDMLDRHTQLRHLESIGTFECRFCRMRFKWKFQLGRHMRRHYTKYECLRCDLKCALENTVLLHEEYHSGITRRCAHCGQEFRHSSTYYTHMRTHRSEHVCALCGASFVSALGLHNHKKVKHVTNEIESPDDDEEVNTYCAKCNITFETRKAYEEHLFHSAMHSEGNEGEFSDEIIVERKRKVLSKTEKEKVIKTLRTRERPDDAFKTPEVKRRRRMCKKMRRKPTTCYQCGKHFETQAACMKHHHAEHPRTSFFPPAERHICEICGASLAPGSVAMHQNIHSRETMHTCDTCGKQFHSTIGLKRHLVTHTGEKRFACPLCDKRFTQSNSMKLHYRTYHLKQPYPKRNRRKKKEEPQKDAEAQETTSEEESDNSLPELDSMSEPQPGIEPVPGAVPAADADDEDMHYMRL